MVADILICLGVGVMVVGVIVYKVKEAKKAKKSGGCSCCSECRGDCNEKRGMKF